MNTEQKSNLKSVIEELKQIPIDEKVAELYKDFQDLNSILIGQYTLPEFVEFLKKTIQLFDQILNTKLASALPYQYQFHNEFGNGELHNDLFHLKYFFINNDLNNTIGYLQRLIYYLIQNGIWNNKSSNIKSKQDRVDKIQNRLELLSEKLNKNISDNTLLMDELRAEKDNLTTFIYNKNQELSEITNLLQGSRNHSDEIYRLHNNSTDINQQIIGLLNQQNLNIDLQKERITEEKDTYEQFRTELKDLKEKYNSEIKTTNSKNKSFEELLENVQEKSRTFEERLIVLNEIIGKEGAVKLFNTFNERKKELEAPVKRWTWIVFVTGIVALAMIISIFTNFYGLMGNYPNEINWQYLVVNSLKSTPIIVVLYFAIKQYVRERNFQEEYAFRSAIALTVQAYGDIAGSKKEELIFKAVENIFNTPTMMKEKSQLFSVRTKMLSETIKELNETIKTLKP